MISALRQEVVEEGREHPFVEALVAELRADLAKYRDQLETTGEARFAWLQGGAFATRALLNKIQKTEGEHE